MPAREEYRYAGSRLDPLPSRPDGRASATLKAFTSVRTFGDYASEFVDGLFALEKGSLSDPVKTDDGFHIIRVDNIREGTRKSFDDVRGELLDELKKQRAEDIFYTRAEELDDFALESLRGLSPVADQMGLELKRIDGFGRGGGLPLGFSPNLVGAVFSLEVLDDGENSPLIELDDGRAVVVHVIDHRVPAVRPLESVRAEITDILQLEQASAMTQEAGARLLAELRAGEGLTAAVGRMGLEIVRTSMVGRSSQELPSDLLAATFRAPKPDAELPVYSSVQLANGSFAVYQLVEVVPGRPEDIPREQRDNQKELLARETGQAQAASLVADLRKNADVTVAADLLGQQEIF